MQDFSLREKYKNLPLEVSAGRRFALTQKEGVLFFVREIKDEPILFTLPLVVCGLISPSIPPLVLSMGFGMLNIPGRARAKRIEGEFSYSSQGQVARDAKAEARDIKKSSLKHRIKARQEAARILFARKEIKDVLDFVSKMALKPDANPDNPKSLTQAIRRLERLVESSYLYNKFLPVSLDQEFEAAVFEGSQSLTPKKMPRKLASSLDALRGSYVIENGSQVDPAEIRDLVENIANSFEKMQRDFNRNRGYHAESDLMQINDLDRHVHVPASLQWRWRRAYERCDTVNPYKASGLAKEYLIEGLAPSKFDVG